MSAASASDVARPTLDDVVRLAADGALQLVTSDVFDTIVTRDVALPSDLFVALGAELIADGLLPSHVTPLQFEQARREAERRARASIADEMGTDATECTIEEIWTHMPEGWVDSVDAMVERELALEGRRLRPVPVAIEALRSVRSAGVEVVLVSDIYLSARQLGALLEQVGVSADAYDDIVASADHRMGKSAGLLASVIARHGATPARVAHIGDNEHSDLGAAVDLGVMAVHVEVADEDRHAERPAGALRWYSRSTGCDGGATAAMRAASVGAGGLAVDPAWQFGAIAAGPTIAGFARWAALTTERLGVATLHCLLREGKTIAELIDIVAPDGPSTRLVHASRWVDMRAAVVDGTPDEVYGALARRHPITVEDVSAAFGCDPERVARRWGGRRATRLDTLPELSEAILEDDALREQILASAGELRTRVMRQLRRELDLGGDRIVVCDVGWGGSIQIALTRILRAEGVDTPVTGLYLALSPTGEERIALGHDIRSYLPSIVDDDVTSIDGRMVAYLADSLEQLLTPHLGTLLDIDRDGRPVLAEVTTPQPASLLRARQGVFDTARELARIGIADDVWVDDTTFRARLAKALAEVLVRPSPGIAEALIEWPHDDVAGRNPTPLSGDRISELVRWSNVRDLESLRPTEAAWLEGLAAVTNPSLATQIAVARRGMNAGELVPPSPVGVSRLSAFAHGSDMADPGIAAHLSTHPEGWSVLRLRGPYASLRALRFDAGDQAAMVQVKHFDVTVTPADGEPVRIDLSDLRATSLEWVDAAPHSRDRYVEHATGHLIIPVEPAVGGRAGSIDAMVVFRRWELASDDPALRIPLRAKAVTAAQRGRRAVDRLRQRSPLA